MKELRLWIAAVVAAAGLASCSSAYYAASGYAGDDLYVQHDRAQIARKQQAEAEAKKAEAEARRAEWEARIAEAQAAAAENDYYEYRSADSNPYQSILADDYESAYARRLRGFAALPDAFELHQCPLQFGLHLCLGLRSGFLQRHRHG